MKLFRKRKSDTVLRSALFDTLRKIYDAVFDELVGAAIMAFATKNFVAGSVLSLVCIILQFTVSFFDERDRE